MLTKRVQVLFDPVEFERLQKIARREKESVGALIRWISETISSSSPA